MQGKQWGARTVWDRGEFVACRTHVCFVLVKCVTFVRFNRYQIVFLYDPLSFYWRNGRIHWWVVSGGITLIIIYHLQLQPST